MALGYGSSERPLNSHHHDTYIICKCLNDLAPPSKNSKLAARLLTSHLHTHTVQERGHHFNTLQC